MVGRKEVLTESMAKKIVKMIEMFPDNDILVSWDNVILHCKKRLGIEFERQSLSQKTWGGRKLIAEAFREAKAVQRRLKNGTAKKYKTASREILQQRIADLEAKLMAVKAELESVRSHQIGKLDAFLNTPRDLKFLLEKDAHRRDKF